MNENQPAAQTKESGAAKKLSINEDLESVAAEIKEGEIDNMDDAISKIKQLTDLDESFLTPHVYDYITMALIKS